MRTTITVDEELLEKAKKMTGIEKTSALVDEALQLVVQRMAAQRLAKLGGSDPDVVLVPRRRPSKAA